MAEKELKDVIKNIHKQFGEGAAVFGADVPKQSDHCFSTGSVSLDRRLKGGYPIGRIIEIYGEPASGKTVLTLLAIAEAQADGFNCAFIDVERTYDPDFAAGFGVDNEALLVVKPPHAEGALDIVRDLCKSEQFAFIVVDSVAAMAPSAEVEESFSKSSVGLQARILGKGLRTLTPIASETDTTIIFINQIREKIGVLYGSPRTTPGGKGLPFYASIRIEVKAPAAGIKYEGGDKAKGIKIGHQVTANIVKSKVSSAGPIEFDLYYFNGGVDTVKEILDLGVEMGFIEKSGSWYTYEGTSLGQGKKAMAELHSNVELYEELRKKVMGK